MYASTWPWEADRSRAGDRRRPALQALARDGRRRGARIGRVVGPADVAALAVHIMTNTALTGATYDVDGGQQFVF
jgi:NAD(P)-dependent dehydrogenase (short-subunit alcohol dehydrogenase family)